MNAADVKTLPMREDDLLDIDIAFRYHEEDKNAASSASTVSRQRPRFYNVQLLQFHVQSQARPLTVSAIQDFLIQSEIEPVT